MIVHCKHTYFIQISAFQLSETLVRCAKELHFSSYYSDKNDQILNAKHLASEIYIRNHASFFLSLSSEEWMMSLFQYLF